MVRMAVVAVAIAVADGGLGFVANGRGNVGDGGIVTAAGVAVGTMKTVVGVAAAAMATVVAVDAGVAVGAAANAVGVAVARVVGVVTLVAGTSPVGVLGGVGIAAVRVGSDDSIGGGDGTGAADGRCGAPAVGVARLGTGDIVAKTIVAVALGCRVFATGVAGGATTTAVDGSRVGTAVSTVVLVAAGGRAVAVNGRDSGGCALWRPVLSAEARRIAAAMANAAPIAVVVRGCATMARSGRGRLPWLSPPLPVAGSPGRGRSTRRPAPWSASDTDAGTTTGTAARVWPGRRDPPAVCSCASSSGWAWSRGYRRAWARWRSACSRSRNSSGARTGAKTARSSSSRAARPMGAVESGCCGSSLIRHPSRRGAAGVPASHGAAVA